MLPVGVDVDQVVDQVDGAGGQAHQHETGGRGRQSRELPELLVKHQGREHEDVLDPLARPHAA